MTKRHALIRAALADLFHFGYSMRDLNRIFGQRGRWAENEYRREMAERRNPPWRRAAESGKEGK